MQPEKKYKKILIVLATVFPLVLLFAYCLFVGFFPYGDQFSLLRTILLAVTVVICWEIFFFYWAIFPKVMTFDRIQELLADQERGGKLLIRRDLELTKANDQLRELDQKKSEFVSIVAHQLRTPLSGIKWMLHMLIKEEFGKLNEEQKSFLLKGYESNERLVALVEDMLNADRIESGKTRYMFEDTDFLAVFDSVIYEAGSNISRKHVKVEFLDRPKTPLMVLADKEKLRAVIQNLIDNAVKYTLKGGTVSVSATAVASGPLVTIMVKDSGIGIPEDQKLNIFNRFFRARNALKVETDGSGLGLFIVKNIIEKHGGTVWFESKENVGTTFYFTLKRVAPKNDSLK